MYYFEILKSVNFEVVKLSGFGGKEQLNLTSTGLLINGAVWGKKKRSYAK